MRMMTDAGNLEYIAERLFVLCADCGGTNCAIGQEGNWLPGVYEP